MSLRGTQPGHRAAHPSPVIMSGAIAFQVFLSAKVIICKWIRTMQTGLERRQVGFLGLSSRNLPRGLLSNACSVLLMRCWHSIVPFDSKKLTNLAVAVEGKIVRVKIEKIQKIPNTVRNIE